MKVKLNRGPAKNQHYEVRDDTYRYLIRIPKTERIDWRDFDPIAPLECREGEYHKSFRRLVDGTVIFEWMGWTDGKV